MTHLFGAVTILLLTLSSVAMASVPPCSTMLQELHPCLPYLTATSAAPSGDCCNSVKGTASYVVTQKDRTDVCNCLKPAVATIAGLDATRFPTLPPKCGVQVTLPPITPDTDCSKV